MNLLLELVRNPAASVLSEVLLHSLWQGTAVAALLALALMLLRDAKANIRYTLACAALALMVALPLGTWLFLSQGGGFVDGPPVVSVFGGGVSAANQAPSAAVDAVLLPWRGWLMIAWLAGVVGFGLRLAGGWWQTQRLLRRDVTPLGEPWTGRLIALSRRLGVARRVRLLESARVTAPLVFGWLKPVILVPVGFVSSLSLGEVDAILAHELAHLRRHDYVVNLLQRLIEALLFYHPAVWWVSERIRIERENCCDDLAASAVGDGRVVAQALVALAERSVGIPALALAADGGALGDRVRRLLGVQTEAGSTALGPKLIRIVGLLLLVAAGIWVVPQLFAPKLYVATARLKLNAPLARHEAGGPAPFDPYFLQTEFEVIRSGAVLRNVVELQGLAKVWSDGGVPLTPETAAGRLRERVRVAQYRNTSLVEVQVADAEAGRAAGLANAVVEAYLDRSRARRSEKGLQERDIMERSVQERRNEAEEIMAQQLKLQDQVSRLKINDPEHKQLSQRLDHLRREYEFRRASYESLVEKGRELGLSLATAADIGEVIDRAEPPLKARRWRPVRD